MKISNLLKSIFYIIFSHFGPKISQNCEKILLKFIDELWNPQNIWTMGRFLKKLIYKIFSNTGVQGKNKAYHNVNKVQNQGIYEWILNLIDIVVCVVFAVYSRSFALIKNRDRGQGKAFSHPPPQNSSNSNAAKLRKIYYLPLNTEIHLVFMWHNINKFMMINAFLIKI